ncbi:glucan endo-1,3-beta-glucosidase 12 isoform X1 [Typha angustifolia]|uniref:glucan endo-1,3-beta-glucosidase 12 isoform X1 n=1 Tax=Typha angustifolia TaxID=59011 RepID=UPI003C3067A1
MVGFYLLSLLPLLGLAVSGQEEAFELVHLQEPKPLTLSSPSIGVLVSEADLPLVSSNVLAAEGWLRTHVLAHFPSKRITTIIVGRGILCNTDHELSWVLVLPCVRNLYYSLVRWGLVEEIKVSAAFSECFHKSRTTLPQDTLKPLVSFLEETSSAFIIDQHPHSSDLHITFLQRLGFSKLRDIRVMKEAKPISRKLSSLSSSPRPRGFQLPSHLSGQPKAPPLLDSPPPDATLSFAPDSPPDAFNAMSPPCQVSPPASPALPPGRGEEQRGGLWCVAKPTVPEENLQEAMDFACGEGGADCEEIRPNGSCYYPDNVVAHSSYAFNSYWQKTKQSGGSCSFDGTAVLINSDPSFLQCHFLLS